MSALFGSRMNYLRRVRVIPSRWFLLVGFRQSEPFGSVAAETDNHFFPASIIF
jgi:hypothetical protein